MPSSHHCGLYVFLHLSLHGSSKLSLRGCEAGHFANLSRAMGLEDVRKLERDSDAKLADPRIYPISPSCNRLPCHGASSKDNLLFTTTCWDRSAISWFSTLCTSSFCRGRCEHGLLHRSIRPRFVLHISKRTHCSNKSGNEIRGKVWRNSANMCMTSEGGLVSCLRAELTRIARL